MAWLSGWSKRIKLTIDHTKVDSTLTQFPVMVKLSTASGISALDVSRVFTDLGANKLKLAITQSDGTTENYVEIEKWDNANSEAILWVSKSAWTISSTVDTVLYLYYDSTHADNNTYVGVVGSTPGKAVWDSNFVMVHHMANTTTSTITDSTTNANNGTKKGANEPVETTGQIGKGQDFDGTDDYISVADSASLDLLLVTLEATVKPDTIPANDYHKFIMKLGHPDAGYWLGQKTGTNQIDFGVSTGVGGDISLYFGTLEEGVFSYIVGTYDGSYLRGYQNAITPPDALAHSGNIAISADILQLGNPSFFNGILDEIRISNIVRSDAWLKATCYSNWDSLITYDIENFPDNTAMFCNIAFVDTPLETSPTWVDISADVREIHTQRGRNHDMDRMESGTLTLVLNNQSGDYWPDNSGGAYYDNVDIMKQIQIQAVYNGVLYNVFTGYIESYTPSYLGNAGYGSLMILHCVGALGKIISLQSLNNAGYAAEQSGTRIDNVLDSCSWPAVWATLDAGQDIFVSTGALANINALSHLQQCQESELSNIYEDTDGTILFEDRSHRTFSPHTISQATFGTAPSEVGYTDFEYVLDEVLLFNDVRITAQGGTEQVQTNSTSITNYGKRTYALTTLHSTDTQAQHLAVYIIARYAESTGRVDSIEITPDSSTKWVQCLERKISDRITIRNNTAGIDKDYFIEGITHDWDFVNGNYVTRFQTSDATLYLNPPDAQNEYLFPNAAGLSNVLSTESGGPSTNNYTHVNTSNDATYVTATFPSGGTDLYNLSTVSYTKATINSVRVTIRAKGSSDTGCECWTTMRTNSTTYNGSANTLTTNWVNYSTIYTTNPYTGVAWTVSDIGSLQAGVNLNPLGSDKVAYCSYVYVVVNLTPGW